MEESVVGAQVEATVELHSGPCLTHIQLVHAAGDTTTCSLLERHNSYVVQYLVGSTKAWNIHLSTNIFRKYIIIVKRHNNKNIIKLINTI